MFTVADAYEEFERGTRTGPGMALDHYQENPADPERVRRLARAVLYATRKRSEAWTEGEWDLHCGIVREAAERFATREVMRITAEIHPLVVRDGELVVPEGLSEEMLTKIEKYKPELRWAAGLPTPPGEQWGRA